MEDSEAKYVIFVRGAQGAGKTTFAKKLGAPFFEADQWFDAQKDGYQWSPEKVKIAHKWCQEAFSKALLHEKVVVVSNMSLTQSALTPYLKAAAQYGANIILVDLHGKFKNLHKVPDEIVEENRKKFQSASLDWVTKEKEFCHLTVSILSPEVVLEKFSSLQKGQEKSFWEDR